MSTATTVLTDDAPAPSEPKHPPRRKLRTKQFVTRIAPKLDEKIRAVAKRDGLRLVEMLEESLAAYLYRLKTKGRPKARKVKPGRNLRTVQLATRVTPAFHTAIHDLALSQESSMVEILEASVAAYEYYRIRRAAQAKDGLQKERKTRERELKRLEYLAWDAEMRESFERYEFSSSPFSQWGEDALTLHFKHRV